MNINHTKGDTFIRNLTFKDSSWSVIDITWSIIVFSLKEKISDIPVFIQQNAQITDALNWEAVVIISNTTMNIDIWNYYYDIQWTDLNSVVRTVLKWSFTISYEVTT